MNDLLGNLVFVVIAILAWIVKEAVERKEQKQADQQRRSGGRAPEADAGTVEEVDVVYGRRQIPPTLTAPPASAPAATAKASTMPPPGAARATPQPALARQSLTMGGLPGVGLGTTFDLTERTQAHSVTERRTARRAWQRLGVGDRDRRLDAVRAGVLWSEVLGVPRAITGPHRSPVLKRRQRR